jgi:hypothetical protein
MEDCDRERTKKRKESRSRLKHKVRCVKLFIPKTNSSGTKASFRKCIMALKALSEYSHDIDIRKGERLCKRHLSEKRR